MTDEALVRAIRRGEIGAFDELYRRYADRLFGFLMRYVHSAAEAEDVLQDVFMTLLRDEALELRAGKVGSWLFTVARNRAIGHHRRQKREAAHVETAETPDPPTTPEAAAQTNELFGHVERAVQQLTDTHAEALVLKVVGGLTYKQIADVQSVPEGTAKSRLHFAVRAVQRFIATDEQEHNDEPRNLP